MRTTRVYAAVAAALLVAAACPAAALDVPPPHARGGRAWRELVAAGRMEEVAWEETPFTQVWDHFNSSDTRHFKQRWYWQRAYPRADGSPPPLFFYFSGEGPDGSAGAGYVRLLAQQYNAQLVSLEHRFYGQSVPGNDFSVENLAYLTVEQSLADARAFIDAFLSEHDMHDSQVFTFGGSYAGALSAWFRLRYPTATNGSLASSGVVNAIYDFVQFDEQVATSSGSTCANLLRNTTAAFEAAFAAGKGDAMRTLMGAPQHLSDDDFFYMLADGGAMAVQYGHMTSLCSAIESGAKAGQPLTSTFATFIKQLWGDSFAAGCFYDTACLANDSSRWQPTSRAWRWQKCSQLAYLQAAPASGAIRSSRVNMDYMVQQCKTVYGDGVDPQASSAAFNNKFGGATPKGSNIFFSNGSQDPWQKASVTQTLSPSMPAVMAVCDSCGHCGDLSQPSSGDAASLKAQRAAFEKYLQKWL